MRHKILIVEDEPLIALGIESDLIEAGFDVVGVAGTIEKTKELIAKADFDLLILDGNLHGSSTQLIAEMLTKQGTPFVVLTGYSSGQLGEWVNDVPRITKPYGTSQLLDAISKLLG